ncbi:MAG: helix-turn-helix transcriptional regulator [Ruminococcaceae bacterium]|nr:helix-turn-helix transcriptional regulator [Oscillospiraceae bacterium]
MKMTLFTKKENENPVEEKINDNKTLGERLSAARKNKGLTQDDFAKYLDVTPQAISKWENNLSCPDILLLPKISEILGIGIEELLTGTEKKEEKTKIQTTSESKLKLKIKISPPNKKPTNITVPVALVKRIAKIGNGISGILGNSSLSSSQIEEILELTEEGVSGEILNIEADDSTVITVEISK